MINVNEEYSRLRREEIEQIKKINAVAEYFRKHGKPVIVSLNDSQGVNLSAQFNKPAFPGLIARTLEDEGVETLHINMSSLLFNKANHAVMFLNNDIDMETNRRLQIQGSIKAIEKALSDFGFPKFIGKVGNFAKLVYRCKKENCNITVQGAMHSKGAKPIALVSTGANDLMRIIGTNPAAIEKDLEAYYKYKNREFIKEEEKEAAEKSELIIEKANDPETINKVIEDTRKVIDNLLRINPKTIICMLGIYMPKSSDSKEILGIFSKVVSNFNERLKELCEEYGIKYIDVSEIGNKYCQEGRNFHISYEGHEAIANEVIGELYDVLCEKEPRSIRRVDDTLEQKEQRGIQGLEADMITVMGDYGSVDITKYNEAEKRRRKEIGDELYTELSAVRDAGIQLEKERKTR